MNPEFQEFDIKQWLGRDLKKGEMPQANIR